MTLCVRQGSILGPIYFKYYIRDLRKSFLTFLVRNANAISRRPRYLRERGGN